MRLFTIILIIGLSLPALGAPSEVCSVIAGSPPKLTTIPSLHVLSLTDTDTFSLPAGLPSNVSAVVCERASLLPAENDYKVLKAGFPLALKDPNGAMLWLELRNGQVAVEYKRDALSQSEVSRLQAWVNRVQLFFQVPEGASSGT